MYGLQQNFSCEWRSGFLICSVVVQNSGLLG